MLQREAELDVYSVREIARAAGVASRDVRRLLDTRALTGVGSRFVALDAAVALVRTLHAPGAGLPAARQLFAESPRGRRTVGVPAAASALVHAGLLAALGLIAGIGVAEPPGDSTRPEEARLVFVLAPGPGGGGGGGGDRSPQSRAAARATGSVRLRSPVAAAGRGSQKSGRVQRRPDDALTSAAAVPTRQPAASAAVAAPLASASSDVVDATGTLEASPEPALRGRGSGEGAGGGTGSGLGGGTGSGIGEGAVAGVGGGPYRPGAGITPPALEREVKPVYTDDARRRGIEGDIALEVVVRADGGIGNVRVVRSLDPGLDRRAVEAVRQWHFSPARRMGTPVDVLVEITVEFRLR